MRLGLWEWSEANPAPTWEALSKGQMWGTDRAKMFLQNFCRPRHTVQVVANTEDNEQALQIKKVNRKANLLVFNGNLDTVPDAVAEVKVRAMVFHAEQRQGRVKVPSHVLGQIEEGVPVLIWGTRSCTERAVSGLREMFQMAVSIQLALYERPPKTPENSRYRDMEYSAVVFAPEKNIQSQVSLTHWTSELH